MYEVYDTFNKRTISKHKTIEAALKADAKFARAVKKHNGANSYIPTIIRDTDGNNVCAYSNDRY